MSNLILDQLDSKQAFFNVREQKLTLAGTEIEIPNKKAIVRNDDDSIIGVVSDSYKVVTNEEVFTKFTDQLMACNDVDLSGATVDTFFSQNGAKTMVNITLPSHEINLNNDVSKMQIIAFNSYDGKWRFRAKAGAVRMACLNGQILGDFIGSYSHGHTKNLSIDKGAEHLINMFKGFNDAKGWWSDMMKTSVSDKTRIKTFMEFLYPKGINQDPEKWEENKQIKNLELIYQSYQKEMGANAWAIYNTLTHHITHKKYKPQTHADRLNYNQERLQNLISKSNVFQY